MMSRELIRVGVREFRRDLSEYLDAQAPVAITRYGQTVGYYVPARQRLDDQELAALKEAVGRLEDLLAERGVDLEEILSEFRDRRAHS